MLPAVRPEPVRPEPEGRGDGPPPRDAILAPPPAGARERIAARTLRIYLRMAAARSRFRYVDGAGTPLDDVAVGARIATLPVEHRPLVVTYWIADALGIALLPLVHSGFASLMASVTCVVDDTFAGRVAGQYVEAIGGRAAMLALPGDSRRLEQVHALMRRRASCAFPVDGGGPYREAGTGIIALAMSLNATILPLAVCATSAVPAIHRSGVRLPWLGTDVVAGLGNVIEVGRRGDRRRLADDLARALDDLGAVVRRRRQSP